MMLIAGQKASQDIYFTGWTCPSRDKSFCAGWKTSVCSSEGCDGDFTCDNPNQPGTKGCLKQHRTTYYKYYIDDKNHNV